jgi:hypothetical protein
MSTRIVPTFLLKGLDVQKVFADYNSGSYSQPRGAKAKITLAQNSTVLAPTYGNSNHDPIFSLKDRNNCNVVVATSGHENFKVFTTTGGDLVKGGRCDHCKKDFEHTAVGYPLGYQERTVLTSPDDSLDSGVYRVLYVFWVTGTFCTFECALGYVNVYTERSKTPMLKDSAGMLRLLYRLTYPDAGPLRPAQDPALLIVNRGSMTQEEWENPRHIYNRTDRVLMIPAKVEYLRQNFAHPAVAIPMLQSPTLVIPTT